MNEADFTRLVMDIAKLGGWMAVHIRNVKVGDKYIVPYQGDTGLLDLILARSDRGVLLVELKVGKNKPTAPQGAWLAAVGVAGRLWYPSDLDAIRAELLARP